MNNKKIIIKGYAGLGNRLRTISAGIEYAKKTNRHVIIDWCDGMFDKEGINAFDKYFVINDCSIKGKIICDNESFYPQSFSDIDMEGSISKYYKRKEVSNFFIRKLINLGLYILNGFSEFVIIERLIYYICLKCKCFELRKEYAKAIGNKDKFVFGGNLKRDLIEDVVLFVDNVPKYKAETMLDYISLRPEIKEEIDAFVKKHDLMNNSVGVHIRATDKQYIGSIKRLIKTLRYFMKKRAIDKIFLSTDNKEIENVFFREFEGQVIVWSKFIPEESKQGIHNWAKSNKDEYIKERMTREAVLDMFTLTRTKYLLYQFGSTFSEISKVYHKERSKCINWLLFEHFMPFL